MCSRVLWSNNEQAIVVARNMDWASPWPVDLWALPRGIERDGQVADNPLRWTATYGSLVAAHLGSTDGLNEAGLGAHLLWLAEANYGDRDIGLPGLSVGQWLQFYLDRFATVREAVEWTRANPFQLVGIEYQGRAFTMHLALEDASGDSAVIEYLDGKPCIHHGREFTVMTNSPTFDKQLAGLQQYAGFGGDRPLPGTTEAADRYVRAAYYLARLPKPADYREAIAGVLSVARNVAQPFGEADPARPNISATRWRTVCDLTHRVYFFESTLSPFMVWADLSRLDLSPGAKVMKVDLIGRPDRYGDVTADFESAEPFAVPHAG